MATKKFVTNDGLLYFLTKIKELFVAKESGKTLTSNDLTDTLKTNYDTAYTHSQAAHAPSNAEKNIIVEVQKNGTKVAPDTNRKVNITVPTKVSELTNDSEFITLSQVPEGAVASATTPKMDGTAAVGTETGFARGDHIHPSDSTKVDKVEGKGLSTNDYTTDEKNKLAGIATGANKTTVDSALSSSSTNPVQNKVVNTALGNKVDKVSGKGLSTNDYTTAEQTKLAGIDEGANNYTLPESTSSVLGGVKVGTNISVSSGTISVANGSTSAKGVVQLSSATNSTSTSLAATASAVKSAYDLAKGKQSPATTLAGYGITDAYTKTEIDTKLTSAVVYKGTVESYSKLPTTDRKVGDMYNITSADTTNGINAGDNVVWSGSAWDVQGGTVDLSGCVHTSDAMTNTEIDALFTS